MCILFHRIYSFLKVVSHYDFSVLSMSVKVSKKNGVGGWYELCLFSLILGICSTLQCPLTIFRCVSDRTAAHVPGRRVSGREL